MTTSVSGTAIDRHYDYVIVGAGPSAIGLVLGLLEREECSIALVERGGSTLDPTTGNLRYWYAAAHRGRSVRSVPSSITGRRMTIPTGQGLGGTSNINAGIVQPPILPLDLQSWPEPWKSALPPAIETIWHRLQENDMLQQKQRYKDKKKLPESTKGWHLDWASTSATLENVVPVGSPNRRNYYDALLANHPLCNTVDWILDTQVQRLLVQHRDPQEHTSHHVEGVECYSPTSNTFRNVYASRAVILCAGAIESPAILLCSGIGPQSHHHFQGVGKHLQDQWLIPRTFLTRWQNSPTIINVSSNGIASLGYLTELSTQETFQVAMIDSATHDTILPSTLAMAFRLDAKTKVFSVLVDGLFEIVKTLLRLLIQWSPLGYILRHHTSTFLVFMMHPNSEGSVSIESTDVSQSYARRKNVEIKVDVGYCRDPNDLNLIRRAWNGIVPSSHMGVLCEIFPKWIFAVMAWLGRDWFSAFCRLFSQPYYHFSGTCAMKRNDKHIDWVVGAECLALRDHTGIHICDASVFPSMVSCPPALTCCALGYAFSRILSTAVPSHNTLMDEQNSK